MRFFSLRIECQQVVGTHVYFDDGQREDLWPYLVGEPPIDPPPATGTAAATFNLRILLARRGLRGRLGGSKEDGYFAGGIHFGMTPNSHVPALRCAVHCTTFWRSGPSA
jgi:hypothetical protein